MIVLIIFSVLGLLIVAGLCLLKIVTEGTRPDFKLLGYLNAEQLSENLRAMAAQSGEVTDKGSGLDLSLIKRTLKQGNRKLIAKSESGNELFGFEKWLLENYYVIDGQFDAVHSSLQSFRRLPCSDGLPRVYRIAAEIIKHSEGIIGGDTLKNLIYAYQKHRPLTYCELMSLPLAFKYALLEYITILMSKSAVINEKIESAKSAVISHVDKTLLKNIQFNSYVYGISLRSDMDSAHFNGILTSYGAGLDTRLDNFYLQLSRYNTLASNAITCMRNIDSFLNAGFLIDLSEVNKRFLKEDAGIYKKMTVKSVAEYLERVSVLSKRYNMAETLLADKTVLAANEYRTHIGGILLDKPYIVTARKKPRLKLCARLYTAGILLLSAALSVCAGLFTDGALWLKIVTGIFSYPIALRIIRTIFILSTKNILPRLVPEIDLAAGIPEDCRTMLVVSQLIGSREEMQKAVDNLRVLAAANSDANLSFALLADLPPAQAETADADADITAAAGCATDSKQDIRVYIRRRVYNKESNNFCGYERKRGALINLNEHLLKGSEFFWSIGDNRPVKYIIALDADTMLNSARTLVGAAMHPQNAYAEVITPVLSVNPITTKDTLFACAFGGKRGQSAYNGYDCDNNFRLFKKGNYCGKGIYRIKEFYDNTKDAYPDNRILSHDYLEGAYCGAAHSTVDAYETAPENYSQWITRGSRWMRGDIQLMPYLFPMVKDKHGTRVKNRLSTVCKLNIFSNIIDTMIPVSIAIYVILCAIIKSRAIFAIVIAALIFPLLTGLVYVLRRVVTGNTVALLKEIKQLFTRMIINIATLFHRAILTLYIHAVTLFRLLISKKNLLKWQTFSQANRGNITLGNYLFMFTVNYLVAVFFILTALFTPYGVIALTLSIGAVLIIAPLLCFFSGLNSKKEALEKDFFKDIAKDTWKFFERQFGQRFLVSDNYQEDYSKGNAARTSPTNIGFSLVSACCAYGLELVDKKRLFEITKGVLTAVEKLPKWNGHLFNWYNNETGKALNPQYVSVVDSGNFLASLITVKGALSSLPIKDEEDTKELIKRIDKLACAMNFSMFADSKKGLLKIGYNHTHKKFDSNYYDLLASEAALTYYILTARGDIDKSFWYNLGRQEVRYKGNTLMSWTGGMFEYMMPYIFMESYNHTLIKESCKNALRSQIRYAKRHSLLAYGISESQYNYTDTDKNYQYMAFGVNNISMKATESYRVISPYSSALGAEFNIKKTEQNLRVLKFAYGDCGYYEAIDNGKIIKTYMAHHQGMTMLSLYNLLTGGEVRKWFNTSCETRAARLLLTEEVPCMRAGKKKIIKNIRAKSPVCYSEKVSEKRVNLLTNGKYSAVVDNEGRVYSSYGLLLTRSKGILNDDSLSRINIIDQQGKTNISEKSECTFSEHKALYKTKHNDLEITQEIFVPSNINGDIRYVTVRNSGSRKLEFKLESYSEVVLCEQGEDLSHPAFSGMFIESEYDREEGCLIFRRRNKDDKLYFVHAASINGKRGALDYESNKANYYNRGGAESPKTGNVLDPIASFAVDITLLPGEKKEVAFANFATSDFKHIKKQLNNLYKHDFKNTALSALGVYDSYKSMGTVNERRLRDIASGLLYGSIAVPELRELSQSGALRQMRTRGINVSRPFWIIEYKDGMNIRQELTLLKRLSCFYINFNCVIIFEEDVNYLSAIRQSIDEALAGIDKKAGGIAIVVLNAKQEKPEFIHAVRMLSPQKYMQPKIINFSGINAQGENRAHTMTTQEVTYPLGIGGFTKDDGYLMDISRQDTPKPWSNIISYQEFGTLITERGGGYTFLGNSREHKLTTHANSPSNDRFSELIILSEDNGHTVWSPVKACENGSDFVTVHLAGATEFYNNYNGIDTILTETVDKNGKYYILSIKNNRKKPRRLKINLLLDAVLGENKSMTRRFVYAEKCGEGVKITNADNGITVFIDSNYPLKTDNLGMQCIDSNVSVAGEIEVGDERKEFIFSISKDPVAITEDKAAQILRGTKNYFGGLGDVTIKTQDETVDILANTWLPYQILSARYNARCGYYQAGGAIGFRDQLQDAVNLLYVDSEILKKHIILCCKHQYVEGDVQHWWHFDRFGVRTRISDDLVFLPWAVIEYIRYTGDTTILSEQAPYLNSPVLGENEHSRLEAPAYTDNEESVYLHCLRAILKSAATGKHGLALMGGGDWNDAMDKVGINGRGESVWLSMFLYYVTKTFLNYVIREEDKTALSNIVRMLRDAVTEYGYNGEWFNRAYDDEGNVIGSPTSFECKIDLISQAWAYLSGIGEANDVNKALSHAKRFLVDKDNGIIKLLAPPFKRTEAGYITDYPAGVRENGGQYTHAAVWFAKAIMSLDADEGYKLLKMLNPIAKSADLKSVGVYKGEPYVIAADVYSHEGYTGMSGWTYYTGAAGHYYSLIINTLLGINLEGDKLYIRPHMPSHWRGYSFCIKKYNLTIEVIKTGKPAIILDGIRYNMQYIMLTKGMRDKKIIVEV